MVSVAEETGGVVKAYALAVRFTLRPGTGLAFDHLVSETLSKIRTSESGTLRYDVYTVDGVPDERLFVEVYADEQAFAEHEARPHVQRFLVERQRYVAAFSVQVIRPMQMMELYGDDEDD